MYSIYACACVTCIAMTQTRSLYYPIKPPPKNIYETWGSISSITIRLLTALLTL